MVDQSNDRADGNGRKPHIELLRYHGAGNDFLVLVDADGRGDVPEPGGMSASQVRVLCDRHRGFGADGLLVLSRGSDEADLTMNLRNADGSFAETSGNGIRCLVHAAVDSGLVHAESCGKGSVRVLTGAGLRQVDFEVAPGVHPSSITAKVDMGVVRLRHQLNPASLAQRAGTELFGVVSAWLVDVGNPHLVVLGEGPQLGTLVTEIGPALERSEPGGTNVELAWGAGNGRVDMAVWERGAGLTLACGSGTCAVAAVARWAGVAGDQVLVRNPGGDLCVDLSGDHLAARCTLGGASQRVGKVVVSEADLADLVAAASQLGDPLARFVRGAGARPEIVS